MTQRKYTKVQILPAFLIVKTSLEQMNSQWQLVRGKVANKTEQHFKCVMVHLKYCSKASSQMLTSSSKPILTGLKLKWM